MNQDVGMRTKGPVTHDACRLLPLFAVAVALLLAPAKSQEQAPRPVLLQVEGRSVTEALRDLSKPLQLELRADPRLAEHKVTLALHSPVGREILEQLAVVLQANWRREDGRTRTLHESKRRARAITAARRQRAAFRRHLADRTMRLLADAARGGPGVDPGGINPLSRPASELVLKLPRELIVAALARPVPGRGSSTRFRFGVAIPAGRLSPAGRRALLGYLEASWAAYPPMDARGLRAQTAWRADPSPLLVRLSVLESPSPDPRLPGASYDLWLSLSVLGQSGVGYMTTVARPGVTTPAETPEPLPEGASAQAPETIPRTIAMPRGTYRFDRFLVTLAQHGGFDVVADYFTPRRTVSISKASYSLNDLLAEMDQSMGVMHWWDGDVLLVRTRRWAEALDFEPPIAVVDRLERVAKAPNGPTFEDWLFFASRATDDQLTTLESHTGPGGEPFPLHLAPRIRANAPWLRAYDRLTLKQRSLARRRLGFHLERLPRSARQLWREALLSHGLVIPGVPWRANLRMSARRQPLWTGTAPVPRAEVVSPLSPKAVSLWIDARSD